MELVPDSVTIKSEATEGLTACYYRQGYHKRVQRLLYSPVLFFTLVIRIIWRSDVCRDRSPIYNT
jgi:hypothetical protein